LHYIALDIAIMLQHGLLLLHLFETLLVTAVAAPAPGSSSHHYQFQSQLGSSSPDDWKKYVRAPSTRIIHPVSIVSTFTEGNVTNPAGLLTGNGPTILTRTAPQSEANAAAAPAENATPVIVVDFGQNVAGYLSINFGGAVNSTPGLPGVRLAFSESIQYGYLTAFSDFSRSNNASCWTHLFNSSLLIIVLSGRYNYTRK
jgi:hypothetical protein